MDACEYCGGYNAVKWDLEAGDICAPCLEVREQARRDREAALEQEQEDAVSEDYY